MKPVAKTVGGTGMSAGEKKSYPSPNPHAGYEEEVIPHPAVADYRATLELMMPRGDQNYGGRFFGPALETEKVSHTGLLDVCNATRSNEMQKRGHH